MILTYFIFIHFFSFQLFEIFAWKSLFNDWMFMNHWRESIKLQIVNKNRDLFQTQFNSLKWKIYWINVNFCLFLEISTWFLIFQSEMKRKMKSYKHLSAVWKKFTPYFSDLFCINPDKTPEASSIIFEGKQYWIISGWTYDLQYYWHRSEHRQISLHFRNQNFLNCFKKI
jgi:hypothetical protein